MLASVGKASDVEGDRFKNITDLTSIFPNGTTPSGIFMRKWKGRTTRQSLTLVGERSQYRSLFAGFSHSKSEVKGDI